MEQDGRASESGEGAEAPDEHVAWDQRVESTPPLAGDSLGATIAALADPATRSPIPETCPFLRTIDVSGSAAPPIEVPDGSNRCVAIGEPAPQSARQQQLVCLTSGHNNCPRYLRGALVAADALAPVAVSRGPSVPVIASALALVLAAAISVGFLLVRGGFDLPATAAAESPIAAASVPPAPTPTTAAVATASPSALASSAPSAAATLSPPPPTEPPARADASSNAEPGSDQRPLRAPRALPGRTRLLGLHGSSGRQSPQHRQLLRHSVRDGDRDEPPARRPDEHPHRRRDPHAATDPLT